MFPGNTWRCSSAGDCCGRCPTTLWRSSSAEDAHHPSLFAAPSVVGEYEDGATEGILGVWRSASAFPTRTSDSSMPTQQRRGSRRARLPSTRLCGSSAPAASVRRTPQRGRSGKRMSSCGTFHRAMGFARSAAARSNPSPLILHGVAK